jgi:glutathione S-transferase
MSSYELHYWPTIQGRGEFVRLAFEATGTPYSDIARGPEAKGRGLPALMRALNDPQAVQPPFAPPFLKDGDIVVGQTSLILQYLAPTLRLIGRSAQAQTWTQQIQLTIADMVSEAHDTHHPIASGLYYEDQKPEALRRATDFCRHRLPKYLHWFEAILTRNPAGTRHLVGGKLTYADLSLFQLIEGLNYAFPRATARTLASTPTLVQLHRRIGELPRIAAYLKSPRRIGFDEQGLFRRYPELDVE